MTTLQTQPEQTPKRRSWFLRHPLWTFVLVLAAIVVVFAGSADPAADTTPEPAEPAAEPAEPVDEPEPDTAAAVEEAEDNFEQALEEAEDAVERNKFVKADYEDLTAREFAKVVRDPDAHVGEKMLLFGEVFQFDSMTGPDQFLAWVDGDRDTEGEEYGFVSYDHTAFLTDEQLESQLGDVVEGDHFAAYATVVGSFDYDTQIGGSTTAAEFTVEKIKVLPALEG